MKHASAGVIALATSYIICNVNAIIFRLYSAIVETGSIIKSLHLERRNFAEPRIVVVSLTSAHSRECKSATSLLRCLCFCSDTRGYATRQGEASSPVCGRVNNFDDDYFDVLACIMDERADRRCLLFRDRSGSDDSRKLVSVEIISDGEHVWWYSRRKLGHQTAPPEIR